MIVGKLLHRVNAAALGANEDLVQSFQYTIVNRANYHSSTRDDQVCESPENIAHPSTYIVKEYD